MTTREVYEASKGMPWLPPELDWHNGQFLWRPGNVVKHLLDDSLAASAMLRVMVEWLLDQEGFVEFGQTLKNTNDKCKTRVRAGRGRGGLCDDTLHALLLACLSLHKEQPNAH